MGSDTPIHPRRGRRQGGAKSHQKLLRKPLLPPTPGTVFVSSVGETNTDARVVVTTVSEILTVTHELSTHATHTY